MCCAPGEVRRLNVRRLPVHLGKLLGERRDVRPAAAGDLQRLHGRVGAEVLAHGVHNRANVPGGGSTARELSRGWPRCALAPALVADGVKKAGDSDGGGV